METVTKPNARRRVLLRNKLAAAWAVAAYAYAAFFWEIGWFLALWCDVLLLGFGAALALWIVLQPRARQWVTYAFLGAGALACLETLWIGAAIRVAWMETRYVERIEAAFDGSWGGDGIRGCGPCVGGVLVDRSDAPPVRAAITWFAAHGDWNGVVYDPTAAVGTREHDRRGWLWGSRYSHLWGPWYLAGN